MRRELERIDIPGEHEARERAWAVATAAFAARAPQPRRSPLPRVAAVALALAALLSIAVSPPGRAVLDGIREVVGVERAQPALFSLPSPGALLVASDAGVWVVRENGSKRLLGEYREASWSPLGRFVVAARANELAALEPDGEVRWTLARPGVRSPRWTGTETDTRIAYVDRTGIRIVAGDGTDDRLLVPGGRGPLAWRPGAGFVLAYAARGNVRVVDAETGRLRWQAARPPGPVKALEWSQDGSRLAVLSPFSVRVVARRGTITAGSREVAFVRVRGNAGELVLGARVLFRASGELVGAARSPDGRWLLVTWPTADQWVFVRADGGRISAVANVSEQFRSRSSPRIEGWCCAG